MRSGKAFSRRYIDGNWISNAISLADIRGLSSKKTLVQQDGKDIFISLVVDHTEWTLTPQRGQCKPLTLDSELGTHTIYYKDGAGKTNLIGFTEFRKDSNLL